MADEVPGQPTARAVCPCGTPIPQQHIGRPRRWCSQRCRRQGSFDKVGRPKRAPGPCGVPGCPEPRHVATSGYVQGYCTGHTREKNLRGRRLRAARGEPA